MTITSGEIDWNDPDAVEKAIGIPIDDGTQEGGSGGFDLMCNGVCSDCMTCNVDDIGTKLSAILCCKSHPETGEVDSDTGACPNYNMDNGECKVYNTDDYPSACNNYHCKTHGR